MKISNKITKQLGTLITGDTQIAPYLSGPQLVDFYNDCGFDDIYGEGFLFSLEIFNGQYYIKQWNFQIESDFECLH